MRVSALAVDRPRVDRVLGLDGYVLRWVRWGGEVLAIVQGATTTLLRSRDSGASFARVAAPEAPQSAIVVGAELLLLADGALYSTRDGATFSEVAAAAPAPALAHRPSSLVSALLLVHARTLWAGSPTTGEVFALAADLR